MAPVNARRARFGPFEFDPRTGELHGPDGTVRLSRQRSQLLEILVEHAPDIATRREIEQRLWPNTIIVTEVAIRAAMKNVRDALGDSIEEPKYIETIPQRGYRLICPVEWLASAPAEDKLDEARDEKSQEEPTPKEDRKAGEKPGWRRRLNEHKRLAGMTLLASILVLLALTVVLRNGRFFIARYYNNRGVQSQSRANLKDAIADYDNAIRWYPRYAAAHYNLADASEEIGIYDRSVKEYQVAIQEDPEFYEAYNNLARLYIKRLNDSSAAVALIERALALQPAEESVRYSLHKNYGWAKLSLNLPEEAEHDLRLAISIQPNYGAAHCLLAKVLEMKGRAADALHEWEMCVAYGTNGAIEPEWRLEGQERLEREAQQ
jgi:DNA-binding winged helix-turn-helix (wHTH) protein/Tfp pilus assembly protein PilF